MFPSELLQLNQWVCWQAMPDDSRPGRIKKIPINPLTGGQAQSNNPSTWATYAVAQDAAKKFNGLGFMFANGIFGVDIDSVQDDIDAYKHGEESNIIYEFIHTLASYAEYSVSGNGIHIICKGSLPPKGRRKANVEMYSEGRFFIMTGNQAAEYFELNECTELIKPLHEKYIGGGSEPTIGTVKVLPLSLSQSEIIKLAEQSKQGQMFSDLYAGRWQSYFQSQSEADLSFCNMLAFWCQRDEALMNQIFRSSGLMRPKWDRKQSGSTYGAMTINKAASECRNCYEGKEDFSISIGSNKNKKPAKLYTFDDTGNAERVFDSFGEKIRYSYIDRRWMYYDGRKWCTDSTGAIKRMVDEVVEKMRYELKQYIEAAEDEQEAEKQFLKHIKSSRSNKAKTAMIKETEHRVPVLPSQLDTSASLLNTTNGIVNLRTGELLPHDSTKMLSKIAFTEYTDKIDHPIWDSFLETTFQGDQGLIRYIQKAIGYSLSGSVQEQCAFFCYGEGLNGKSTFLDTISDIMGDYAINIQPETIMVKKSTGGPSSDIARLKGARFVTCVEPDEGMRLNEGLIKQLTGGDKVTARKLYGDDFEFKPDFKLWMGTNHKPIIRGTDLGIWRRIRLIPFTARIPDNKVDKHLKHKLKQEYPAILSWAVDGCLLWQREGLKSPLAIEESISEYRNEMDVISKFLEECTEIGHCEKASDLYRSYSEWAVDNNEYRMSNTKFGNEISKRFEKARRNDGYIYLGVKIRKNFGSYGVVFGNN